MSVVSGTIYGVEESIKSKLVAAGATSRDRAVSPEDANLDMQEQNWLSYIAGGLFARVKKAAGNLYYVAN
jgi:hypothetical protein